MIDTLPRKPKAADIPDAAICAAVEAVRRDRQLSCASRWDVAEHFPEFPLKVVSAKLNAMVRRGILEGCSSCHDCRGDFTVMEPEA